MDFVTPLGTAGLGNPSAPTDTSVGSGDPLVTVKYGIPSLGQKPKKKFKSLKEFLKNKAK